MALIISIHGLLNTVPKNRNKATRHLSSIFNISCSHARDILFRYQPNTEEAVHSRLVMLDLGNLYEESNTELTAKDDRWKPKTAEQIIADINTAREAYNG
jgi:hypothetical protein